MPTLSSLKRISRMSAKNSLTMNLTMICLVVFMAAMVLGVAFASALFEGPLPLGGKLALFGYFAFCGADIFILARDARKDLKKIARGGS